MSAGRLCSRVLVTATSNETIRTAARRMAENDVGTLVVLEAAGVRAVGMLTDRDITIRAAAEGLDLDATPVWRIMTTPVQGVHEATPLEQALARMAASGTRRLLVTGDVGRPVGILTLDDVLDLLSAEVGAVGRLLERQQPHIRMEQPALPR